MMERMSRLGDLLRQQDGVIARAQLLESGHSPSQVRGMLRRRELALLLPGVYVVHTGEPTWLERSWAAVLHAWPAALSHESALRAEDGPGRRGFDESAPIHVAIAHGRKVRAVPGVAIHRRAHLDHHVLWNRTPPRVRTEEAVLDVAAAAASEIDAIAVIADAVGSRRTTAGRVQQALAGRQRIARRNFLDSVLGDVEQGACSVLEHGYLTRVERAHGIPAGERQVRASLRGPVYRDVVYERFDQVVELDGRLDHTRVRDRAVDLDRDLAAAVERMHTVRLGWAQVFDRSCWTAEQIGLLLRVGGWKGATRRCSRCSSG